MNTSRNPLPYETDGVLLDGTVVNSAISVNSVNESCWTLPNIPLIHSSSPAYLPDTCQICGIQGGVGPVAWYAAWVRDANNSAVGNMPVVDLGPGTSVGKTWQFSAAGGFLTMLVLPGEHPTSASAVSMMWGDQPEPQMYFDPIGTDSINCSLQGDAQDGTVTYFQCHFDCGLALDPSTRRSLDMAHSEREYREDNSPSVSHQQPRQVEKRSPPLSL